MWKIKNINTIWENSTPKPASYDKYSYSSPAKQFSFKITDGKYESIQESPYKDINERIKRDSLGRISSIYLGSYFYFRINDLGVSLCFVDDNSKPIVENNTSDNKCTPIYSNLKAIIDYDSKKIKLYENRHLSWICQRCNFFL